MKLTYVAWKQVISSDVKRILYGIQGGISNKGDQAIQNFNSLGKNPGLWGGFTDGKPVPDSPDAFAIPLANSQNKLKLWHSSNDGRQDPIKINMQIWDRKVIRKGGEENDHGKHIIETWYVAYVRILSRLLGRLIHHASHDERIYANEDTKRLKAMVDERLAVMPDNVGEVFAWICETQDMFLNTKMDTKAFLTDGNLASLKAFVEDFYYLVVKYVDNGEEKNAALVANINAAKLHPDIRKLLVSGKVGGKSVDMDMRGGAVDAHVDEILNKLYREKNVLLYGALGTGKTRLMTQIAQAFQSNVVYDCMDTEAPIALDDDSEAPGAIRWCTFHPGLTYEEFVWGLSPKVIGNKLGYAYHKGPFLEQVLEGRRGKRTLLIIDEINRANTDDVFGDCIRLLDKRDRGKVSVPLPASMGVPGNKMECGEDFYVIGTMNSLDKSVSPLAPELKRIFSIVEMMPDEDVLRDALRENESIPAGFAALAMGIFVELNAALRKNVGKEYMLGQGYLWDLVSDGEEYEAAFADILRHKILPHLKDVYPQEKYLELFQPANHGILFRQPGGVSEICDVGTLSDGALIDAFARICGQAYSHGNPEESVFPNFDSYRKHKLDQLYQKLTRHTNVILAGASGVGKSAMLEALRDEYGFEDAETMYWHNSTAYEDVVEGISAVVNEAGDDVEYGYADGVVKKLAERAKGKRSLMCIENLDKSNAGENFGELITLLEPDKRASISIEGYEGSIKLPEKMHFLCTMNPLSLARNKMDSALKRRFVILELYPDYKLLSLWLGVEESNENYEMRLDTRADRLKLALELLRSLNARIANVISVDAQLGHGVLWDLKDTAECSLSDIAHVFDERILPMIEDYCVDYETASRLLGENSPLLQRWNFGVEIIKLGRLDEVKRMNAFKGLIQGEV